MKNDSSINAQNAPLSLGKILVIHPKDETTDFLKPVYEGLGAEVITDPADRNAWDIAAAITGADTILLMGHGSPEGLWDMKKGDVVIGKWFSKFLRKKNCIGIWCHADEFFKNEGLHGFCTGMFISESDEAFAYQCPASEKQIANSNAKFVAVLKESFKSGDIRDYVSKHYKLRGNPCVKKNRHFMLMD